MSSGVEPRSKLGQRVSELDESPPGIRARSAATGRRLASVPALDGVRAVAIICVIALHVAYNRFPGGTVGVDIFFTLSAFLITSLVLEEVRERGGAYGFKAFYWRRAMRLGPALLIWLAVVAPLTSAAIHEGHSILTSTGLVLTYTSNLSYVFAFGHLSGAYGQAWSLAVEEQFYLVWPLVLVLIVRHGTPRLLRRVLWVGLVAAVGLLLLGILVLGTDRNYFSPTGHLIPLAAGCLAAEMRYTGIPPWLEGVIRHSAVPVVVAVAILTIVLGYNSVPNQGLLIPASIVVGLGSAFVILQASIGVHNRPLKVLESAPMRWVGQRSYGLYLYFLTLFIIAPALDHGLKVRENLPATIIGAGFVTAASYRFVERPMLRRYKHRFDVPATGSVDVGLDVSLRRRTA